MHRTARLLLISAVSGVGLLVAAVPSEASGGAGAEQTMQQFRLSKIQMNRVEELRKSGVEVFLPTYIPSRFSLKDFGISKSDPTSAELDYTVQFSDKKKLCFSVESAATGIGDGPDGDRQLKGHSKTFGNFIVDVFKPNSEGNGTNLVYYLSSWMELKPVKAAGKSAANKMRYYHLLGNGISDKEAVQIIESLAPVR